MVNLTPRDTRLVTELVSMQKLVQESSFFRFEAKPGEFPEEYVVTFSCLGLVRSPHPNEGFEPGWRQRLAMERKLGAPLPGWLSELHIAHIKLPADFPIQPPQIRFSTPIYHPNIKTLREEDLEALLAERLGGIENVRQVLQARPELQEKLRQQLATFICLDGIKRPEEGGNYTMRLTLYDICHELGQMIMFQRYNLKDPLDPHSKGWTEWAEKQGLLPIDDRPFLDKLPPIVRVIAESSDNDLDIQVIQEKEP